MNNSFVFELKREILHVGMGIVIVMLALYSLKFTLWFLFCILILGGMLSIASKYFKIPVIYSALKLFERPEYLKTFPGKGVLFYAAGCLLALKLFSLNTALASVIILAFGDSFSHLAGKLIKNEEKEIESAVAGIIFATLTAQFFVGWILAFIGSCVAITVEFIGLKLGQDNVDDNLLIPIVAGTAIHLASKILAMIF